MANISIEIRVGTEEIEDILPDDGGDLKASFNVGIHRSGSKVVLVDIQVGSRSKRYYFPNAYIVSLPSQPDAYVISEILSIAFDKVVSRVNCNYVATGSGY